MDKATATNVNKRADSYNDSVADSTSAAAAKRTKMMTNNILTLLDENSLLQVLLRTRCEDHNALRQTCRHFQSIIDSELFCQQRAQQEWAEVEVHVLTAEENFKKSSEDDVPYNLEALQAFNYSELGYKHYCGAIQNEFRVLVDGKVGGSGSFTLIERNGSVQSNNFHATCDAVSQEVRDTGCLFFDKKGRPRMPSLKDAMNTNNAGSSTSTSNTGLQNKDYFVYLDRLKLNPEHRQNTTWVGAKAIHSLLLDSPLKDKWSVAIYIADVTAHQTKQDEQRAWRQEMYERNHFYSCSAVVESRGEKRKEEDEKALQENCDWLKRMRSLKNVDLCQFVRCGFQQVTENFQKSSCLYVMALPAFLSRPMLSHKEALAVNIVDKKDLLPGNEMSPMDSRLSRFMVHSCTTRQQLFETISSQHSTPPPSREEAAGVFDSQLNGLQRQMDATEQRVVQARREQVEAMQAELDRTRTQLEQFKSMRSQISTPIEELDETGRNLYQGMMLQIQQLGDSVEFKNALIKEKMSGNDECLGKIAEIRECVESLKSQREALIEEAVQQELSARAEALTTARADLTRHDMAVKAEVTKLVGADNINGTAASVKNSNALHACAVNMIPEYIDLLLEYTPQTERRCALNKFDDSEGLTPLMAVAVAPHLSSNPELRIQMTNKLISLGADKNIEDVFGETALGKFRAMRLSGDNVGTLFGWAQQPTQAELDRERMRMEQLLRPFGGPTAADDSYLNASDNSDDDNDEVDEHEEEEDRVDG